MNKANEYYLSKIDEYNNKKEKLQSKISVIALVRLFLVASVIYLCYTFYNQNKMALCAIAMLIGFAIFVVIAIYHGKEKRKIEKINILINLNEKGIKRINGEWKSFEDKGIEFVDEGHGYSNDLDIFGQSSLFQWINSTVSAFGRKSLFNKLSLKETLDIKEIKSLQEGIKELANKIQWRQELISDARIISKEIGNIEGLLKWAATPVKITFTMKYIPYLFLAITYIFIILSILGKVPVTFIILILMMNFCAIKFLTKDAEEQINLFDEQKKNIYAYSTMLEHIENEDFESSYLYELKKDLVRDGFSCKKEMKSLKSLVEWVGDSKRNAYYFILNILTFSDVFIVCNLESWREKNGKEIEKWLNIMGEFEALISISNIAFEHDTWEFPAVEESYVFQGNDVGHPLLSDESKCNNFNLSKENVCLITGSNMSGKSTFLRTIGLNMILSYIGAPVRGHGVKCGKFNIYTCMRTKDNLEERISSFYAEIMRIKQIVEAVQNGEKVFFLLDEIFKGTNSEDRHIGAKVLIAQLQNSGAVGLVSTHDLDLCDLEKKYIWLKNYNFREFYEDNQIKFDYILRKGKSETRNAIHLMKLAGIKVD